MDIKAKVFQRITVAKAAIDAGARAGGMTLSIGELISGILSIFSTANNVSPAARDATVIHIMIDLVSLVGRRRAHEIVDIVADNGAGDSFS